jgi:hypothetical protein
MSWLEEIELKRNKRTSSKIRVQTTRRARPRRARRVRQQKPVPTSNRALIAIIMLFYMLHLIDDKSLKNFTKGLYPRKAARRRRGRPSKKKLA